MIHSKSLANEATSVYSSGKEFAYDHVMQEEVIPTQGVIFESTLSADHSRPYTAGARDSEKYFNPDITKVNVKINGSPNRIYNSGIDGKNMWTEISLFFGTKKVIMKGGQN